MRRRLLLERAAWQLRTGAVPAGEAAPAAGYGSPAAVYGHLRASTECRRASSRTRAGRWSSEAPNGIHFHPPAGLLIPGAGQPVARGDLTERMVSHHVDRVRELLEAAATLPESEL
jgi:hypothetical protein